MTEIDPYNYPFPNKQQTMYLQTINQADAGFQKIKIIKPECTALRTNDISGANPILPGYRYSQKETFVNRTNDIDGCFPKKIIRENISKTVFNLKIDDIKGTRPQINKFCATRHSNPLEPEYKLPSAQIKVSTPPKFIRDNINITDIDGTRPNPYNSYKLRKTHIFEDVEGSKPKKMFIPKDQINILDVRDINEYLQFKTSRVTNPLNPVYPAIDENGQKIEIGEIEYSKSRQLHPVVGKRDPSLDLKTLDIDGAWAGTHSEKFLRKKERKHYIQTLKTDDIPGAQVSTLKKGMTTGRKLNPIWPFDAYPYLGAKEEILEKLTGNNSSLAFNKHDKNKSVVETKSILQTENITKPVEVLHQLPLTESNVQKENGNTGLISPNVAHNEGDKDILKNSAINNILPSDGNNKASQTSRKASETHNSRKASETNLQKKMSQTSNGNKPNNKIFGTNSPPEQSQIVNNNNTSNEKELKFYSGTKEMAQSNYKTKLTTAQNLDKFIQK